MMRHHQTRRVDRCFDIDEPTTDTPPRQQNNWSKVRLSTTGLLMRVGSSLSVKVAVGGTQRPKS